MSFAQWLWVLSAFVTLCSPLVPAAAQQSRPTDEITKLAEDVYLFRHQAHQSIFVVTPEGVTVTDPISLEAATWLKTEIAKLTEQPVRYVIYSHHHNDHITGGRSLLTKPYSSAIRPHSLKSSQQPIPRRRFHSSPLPIA